MRVGHTDYTRISDGVSCCGELFDLTDCTAHAVWEVPLNQQQFSFPQCHVIYKLSGVAPHDTLATPVMRLRIKLICTLKK